MVSLVPDPMALRRRNSAEFTLVDRPRPFWKPEELTPAECGGLRRSLCWGWLLPCGWLLPDRSLEVDVSSRSRRLRRMLKLFRGGMGEPAGE